MSERFGETEIRKLCEILYDKKADDIVAIHVGDRTIVADWFLIASGRNVPHVKALCDEIEDRAAEAGMLVKRKEGYEQGRWIVLDFGFVLVHLFHPEERAYYNMERLWEEDGSVIRYPETTKEA
ncbi:MAG: ribosome silencing factor [Clostridia bacterium]|jgi:ribosome-associated protein|nr:ribosome silencing factor [Clostridia bacterium]